MVNLIKYENYFTQLGRQIADVRLVKFVTPETEIGEWLGDIRADEQPFMVVVIPSAKSGGSTQDEVEETNFGLLYLLKKIDRGTYKPFAVQKVTPPVLETIKTEMLLSTVRRDAGLATRQPHRRMESELSIHYRMSERLGNNYAKVCFDTP